MKPLPFTRRDFLKLSAAGMLGGLFAELGLDRVSAGPATQGRMTLSGIGLYSEPGFKATRRDAFGRDEVVSITGEVTGEAGNRFNNRWYEINGEGFTYSGWVQPVETQHHAPDFEIPETGRLGEITVPYSITRLQPSLWAKNGYRVYFGSTHWVRGVSVNRHEKSIWYEIYDGKLYKSFYVDAADTRLVPYDELGALSADVPEEIKYVHVDTGIQLVTAFEGESAVMTTRCSSGGKGTRTPLGNFLTYHKGPTVHMSNDGAADAGRGYDLPGVPWVSFFTGNGVAFHGTYWHNDYGTPRSHGCVNLPSPEAKFLYRWTRPLVPQDTQYLHLPGTGTRVEVVSSNS